jgi:surfactin synthase thioesterase subunit
MTRDPGQAGKWTRIERPVANARIRVLCMPYAGGGASTFHNWSDAFGRDVEICAIQLPGRQDRFREPALTNVSSIARSICQALETLSPAPLALFGHSFGALVAFAVALHLERAGVVPRALVVAARSAPQLGPLRPLIHALSPDALVREVERRYDTPRGLLDDPDLRELSLPSLRADLEAMETYAPPQGAMLRTPITALRGLSDATTTSDGIGAWRDVASRALRIHEVHSGHWFLETHRAWVQERVIEAFSAP